MKWYLAGVIAGLLWLPALLLHGATRAEGVPVKAEIRRHILDGDDPARQEFDRLVYQSGIEIKSDAPGFGGLSGLRISADGAQFLAVTDEGNWIKADLVYEDDRLMGLNNIEIHPLLDARGKPFKGKGQGDAEAITLQQPGRLEGAAYVSFEREHRVLSYPQGLGGRASVLPIPPAARKMPGNGGMEAFTRRADGGFLGISEDLLNEAGDLQGWLFSGSESSGVSLRREGIFSPTDMEFLPDGDLLILERRYTVMGGPGMQIRRIRGESIKPGAVLDGKVLINLNARYGIDNFEGLSARVTETGDVLIYIVSDNNFNALQKNLLLVFELQKP